MKKFLLLSLGAVLALNSCSEATDERVTPSTGGEVSFTSENKSPTTRATESSFESGDAIGVFAKDGAALYAENVMYEYVNGKFTSLNPIAYSDDSQELSFVAVYPYSANLASQFTFEIKTDQSSAEAFEASDLLTATTQATNDECPVLSFYHSMSAIEINFSAQTDVSDYSLFVNAAHTANCDIESGEYTATSAISTLTPLSIGDDSYKVVVAPQTIAAGSELISVTVDGVNSVWNVDSAIVLESGYKYICNITITGDSVIFSGDITPWSDGGEINGTTTVESAQEFSLADIEAGLIPSGTIWVITDEEATAEAFESLRSTLKDNEFEGVSITMPNLKILPYQAFWSCQQIKSVSLPVATYLEEASFRASDALVEVYVPEVTTIEEYAFAYSDGLTSMDLPKVTAIADYAFSECKGLVNVSAPLATSIGDHGFSNCTLLESVEASGVTFIDQWAFYNCDALKSISYPLAESLGASALFSCSALTSVSLPKATSIGNYAFKYSNYLVELELATADDAVLSSLGYYLFTGYQVDDTDANITLTLGVNSSDLVSDNTLTVGSYSYTFKEIVFVGEVASDIYLTDFEDETFIPSGTEWVICDEEATAEAFESLRNTLKNNELEGISITMPNLKTLPYQAFWSCQQIKSVSLPVATYLEEASFRASDALVEVYVPEVTTIEEYAFAYSDGLTSMDLPKVTAIADYAFSECKGLVNVSAPLATSIGDHGFSNCTLLESVEASGVTFIDQWAFYNCDALKSISYPLAESLGASALFSCSALTSVSLPKATSIGNYAFKYSNYLVELELATADDAVLSSLGSDLFVGYQVDDIDANITLTLGASNSDLVSENTLTVGSKSYTFKEIVIDGVTTSIEGACYLADISSTSYPEGNDWVILDEEATTDDLRGLLGALYLCEPEEDAPAEINLIFPNLKEVPEQAFWAKYAIASVSLPKATALNYDCFYLCKNMTSISAPEALTIADDVFLWCYALESIDFPKVTSIGDSAFTGCIALETVVLPEVLTIEAQAFNSCYALTSISCAKVETLGNASFYDCDALTSVYMPSVTLLDGAVFWYCDVLASISLPEVVELGNGAFASCPLLATIDIPKATTLGAQVFEDCISLTTLNLGSDADVLISEWGTNLFYSAAYGAFASSVNLTTSSANQHYISGNTMTIKAISYTFNSITVK